MQINPINSYKFINRYNHKPCVSFSKMPDNDVFQKNKTVDSPKNKQYTQIEFIRNKLPQILSEPKNELGRGISNKVYSIPACDDFVIRVPLDFDINKINFNEYSIADVEDKNLKINIGQEVARINFKTETEDIPVSVMKKQRGKSLGVAPIEVYEQYSDDYEKINSVYSSAETKKIFSDNLNMLASFPSSSYEKLVDDVREAAKCGYYFDFKNSNNIMFDESSKTFGLVDMVKSQEHLPISWGSVLFALTNIRYCPVYIREGAEISDKERENAADNIKVICDKFVSALKNKDVSEQECTQCYLAFFSMFMGCFLPR